jgi:hypothetical protein
MPRGIPNNYTEEEKKQLAAKFHDRKELFLEWKGKKKVIEKLAANLVFTIQDIEYALREHYGNYTKAAEFLGIAREVLYRKVQNTPSLMLVMRRLEEENKDRVEYNLITQAVEGVLPAVIFYLKTKGADRGYTEAALQMTGSDIVNAASLIEVLQKRRELALEDKAKTSTKEIEGVWSPVEEVKEK